MHFDIDTAIWRWVHGFHAALYRQPLAIKYCTLRSPFPRADMIDGRYVLRELLPQHEIIVETIKRNRASDNLDRVAANGLKLRYECAWLQSNDKSHWACLFGLDIYDWKDLGSHTKAIPSRGCAGLYVPADRRAPPNAARDLGGLIKMQNRDPLDPFGP